MARMVHGFLTLAGIMLTAPPVLAAGSPWSQLHPLHTTLTEIGWKPGGQVSIQLRVFTEDFGNAARRSSWQRATLTGETSGISDSAALSYLRTALTLTDRAGVALVLSWVGSRRQGDVTFISLAALAPDGLNGVRIGNAINCELFEDEVNIVRATYAGRDESLLFTRGDHPKPLP